MKISHDLCGRHFNDVLSETGEDRASGEEGAEVSVTTASRAIVRV